MNAFTNGATRLLEPIVSRSGDRCCANAAEPEARQTKLAEQ
jgi:hypothetical protein